MPSNSPPNLHIITILGRRLTRRQIFSKSLESFGFLIDHPHTTYMNVLTLKEYVGGGQLTRDIEKIISINKINICKLGGGIGSEDGESKPKVLNELLVFDLARIFMRDAFNICEPFKKFLRISALSIFNTKTILQPLSRLPTILAHKFKRAHSAYSNPAPTFVVTGLDRSKFSKGSCGLHSTMFRFAWERIFPPPS